MFNFNATEARKVTEGFIASKEKALAEKADKWCEEFAACGIEAAANEGRNYVGYRLDNTTFTAEYRNAIVAVLENAGYTVKVTSEGNLFHLLCIEW